MMTFYKAGGTILWVMSLWIVITVCAGHQ